MFVNGTEIQVKSKKISEEKCESADAQVQNKNDPAGNCRFIFDKFVKATNQAKLRHCWVCNGGIIKGSLYG